MKNHLVKKALYTGSCFLSFLLAFALHAQPARAGDIVLAEGGRSEYQIVLPATFPADEIGENLAEVARLVQAVFEANGAELPVVSEHDAESDRPGIYLGATKRARRTDVDLSELEGYDYIHKAVGRDVIIAGNDLPSTIEGEEFRAIDRRNLPRMGTAKAAADFVRKYAGVRFLYPDLRNYLVGWPDGREFDLVDSVGLEFLPTRRIAVPADLDIVKDIHLEYNIWRSRNSHYHIAGNQFPLFNTLWTAHSHQNAVPPDEYYDSHPEYFALLGGQRVRGVQYCISNPGFQERNYEYLASAFDRGYDKVYLGHSDGFRACQCEECYNLYGTGDDWTEKLWIFNRNMAERLYESHPDKTVVLVAYTVTERRAPQSFNAFPPNTMLQMCGTNESDLARWEDVTIPKGITSYIYNWTPNQCSRYVPMTSPLFVEEQVRRFRRHNIRGIYRDGGGPHLFGLEGPVAYVMNRMWDDPDNNQAADLVEEFVEAAFGSAAIPMARFYGRLYHGIELYAQHLGTRRPAWTYRPLRGRGSKHVTDPFQMLGFLYTPSLLETLENELSHAERLADSEKVEARLALVRREFDWIGGVARVIHLYHAHQLAPENLSLRNLLLDAIDARNAKIEGYYDERGRAQKPHSAWNTILFPPGGHNANHLRLAYNRYQESFRDTALNWDTDAVRAAPPPGAKRMAARQAQAAVTLDAALWDDVPAEPLLAMPPAEEAGKESRVQALYDRHNLYLRVVSELPAGQMREADRVRDDDLTRSESVDFFLAPQPGEDIYYRFRVGPASGARYDAASGLIEDFMHLRYGREDPSWTGDWEYVTRLTPTLDQWVALLTIPFDTIGVEAPESEEFWRINVARAHLAADDRLERSIWSATGATRGVDDLDALGVLFFKGEE